MGRRRVKLNNDLDQSLTQDVKPLEVCIADLAALGLEGQEVVQLEEVLDAVINNQVDKILNQIWKS
jgi:hypothetical protein